MAERLRITWAQLALPEARTVPVVITDIQFKMRTASATATTRTPGIRASVRIAEVQARFS